MLTPLLPTRWTPGSELSRCSESAPLREASLHQNGTFGEQSNQGYWFPFEGVLLFASRYGCSGALCDRSTLPFLPPSITSLELQVRQQLPSSSFAKP